MSGLSDKRPNRGRDVFSGRYLRMRERLSPALRKVADFIEANRADAMRLSAVDLARAAGTSDATVVRAVQALGFHGLADLRAELAAACGARNAPSDNLARTFAAVGEDAQTAMDDVLGVLCAALESLRAAPAQQAMAKALEHLHAADRIVVFGIGPTAHIAAYFAARLRRKGRRQAVLDETGAGLADQLLDLQPGDVMLMLAYGAAGREARIACAEARRRRIPVVLLTDGADRAPVAPAAVVLAVPRGRNTHVALHGTTLACMEMLLLGLAALDRDRAMLSLTELDRLRGMTLAGRAGVHPTEETE